MSHLRWQLRVAGYIVRCAPPPQVVEEYFGQNCHHHSDNDKKIAIQNSSLTIAYYTTIFCLVLRMSTSRFVLIQSVIFLKLIGRAMK